MAITVGELSKLTGVTVRALHHYDAIGLVRPSERSAAGYRLYSDADVLRLHQVLLFRELGLPLEEIAAALDEAEDRGDLLRRHREQLVTKRARLDAMLVALDAAITAHEKGQPMTNADLQSMFDGFDPSIYDEEVKQKWGETDAYKESTRRAAGYTKADWDRYKQEAQAIGEKLVALMRAGAPPSDAAVQAAVEEHRLLIDRWFYPCSVAMHKSLGQMYVADPRFTANLDKLGDGYARFLSEAIAAS